MVVRRRKCLIGARKHQPGRRNVEDDQPLHFVRVVQRHAMGNPALLDRDRRRRTAQNPSACITSTWSCAIARFE